MANYATDVSDGSTRAGVRRLLHCFALPTRRPEPQPALRLWGAGRCNGGCGVSALSRHKCRGSGAFEGGGQGG